MKKQTIYFISLLLFLVIGMVACSDNSKSIDVKEDKEENQGNIGNENNEANDSSGDVAIQNLLDWETVNFEESENKVYTFDEFTLPEHVFQTSASDGAIVLSGDTESFYYNYLDGKMSDFELDKDGRPQQRNGTYATSYFFDEYHYTINGEDLDNRDQYHLVEVNIGTGEKKVLAPVEGVPTLSKGGDIIVGQNNEEIFAFDLKKEEKLWEIEPDEGLSYAKAYATDSAVVLQGDEGLVVFSISNGEKMYEYESETYLHYVGTDGNDFYVTEESEETMSDLNESIVHIYKFSDGEETPDKLLTTPAVATPDGIDELRLDIEGDTLYKKSKFGISAYDKNDGHPLWHVGVGEELVQEFDVDRPSHDDFEVSYNNGNAYVLTTLNEQGINKNTFTVIDGKTGDMLENYKLEDGDAYGPAIDGDIALVFHTDSEGENAKVYTTEDK